MWIGVRERHTPPAEVGSVEHLDGLIGGLNQNRGVPERFRPLLGRNLDATLRGGPQVGWGVRRAGTGL